MSMTREEMIEQVKAMSEEDDDTTVGYYLDNAGEIILNRMYPYDECRSPADGTEVVVPSRYLNLQMRMTVVLLNKRAIEGESMHIENGINRHYSGAEIPPEMLREIVPKAVPL